jgi:hypothetical protein
LHNLVEKKYRTQLNSLFAALRSSIPKDLIEADVKRYTRGNGGMEKVVSKGAVLTLARRYIEALEKREESSRMKRDIDEGDTAVGGSVREVEG